MRSKTIFIVVTVGLLAVAGLVATQVHAEAQANGPFGQGRILQRVIKQLDLTPTQLASIKTELRAEKDTVLPLVKRMHEARKNLRDTIQSGGDEAAIRAASAKVAAVAADLAVERGKLHAKIAPILTEEQMAKVKALEEKADDFVGHAIEKIGERLEEK